jgi:hypothetical protein
MLLALPCRPPCFGDFTYTSFDARVLYYGSLAQMNSRQEQKGGVMDLVFGTT